MPELTSIRSPCPHRAMLLHHVAANGIEVERQLQSPPNAVDIMRLLLERGARATGSMTTGSPCGLRSRSATPRLPRRWRYVARARYQPHVRCRGGDLEAVKSFEQGGGVELALVEAATHGPREVVAFLLSREPDLTVRGPIFGATAVQAARRFDHDDIARLLEAADAGKTL